MLVANGLDQKVRATKKLLFFDFLKNFCYNINIENKKKGLKMLKLSMEEFSALNIVLNIIPLTELLDNAMKGFQESEETSDLAKADLCKSILKSLR
jgi:hypothetical protein